MSEEKRVRAYMPHRTLQKDGSVVEGFAERDVVDALHGPTGNKEPLIVCASDRSFPASAASTTDCTGLGFDTSSSVRAILGAAMCSPHGGPESPSTTTFAKSGFEGWREAPIAAALQSEQQGREGVNSAAALICSAAVSRVKTCPSPDSAVGSPGNAPASSTSSHESLALFDPDGFSSRTYLDCSVATAVGTSESSLERWPTSGTAWDGGFSTHVSSECRSDADGCSSSEPSLTEILQPPQTVPARYSLSGRVAQGILRRAEKRGRTLPGHLLAALQAVSTTQPSEEVS